MVRRLFEGFEQGIEGRRREHVYFVNDVDLEARHGRGVLARLAQLPDLFDAVVAGAVYLEYIEGTALGDLNAALVFLVEIHLWSAGGIEAFGENAGDGCFSGPARPAKNVSVSDALLFDGVGQRLGDVFLTHDVVETLRAVLAGDYLISHLFWIFDLRFTIYEIDPNLLAFAIS